MATYYEVLGVEATASTAELQRAYRARARQLHPDVAGDEEAMRALNEAWHVLRNPSRRARYDLEMPRRTAPPATPDVLPPPSVPPLRLTLWMLVVAVLFLIFVVTAYAGHVSP